MTVLFCDVAGLLRAHQWKHCDRDGNFVCKSGCKVPMVAGELPSVVEARHQAAVLEEH